MTHYSSAEICHSLEYGFFAYAFDQSVEGNRQSLGDTEVGGGLIGAGSGAAIGATAAGGRTLNLVNRPVARQPAR